MLPKPNTCSTCILAQVPHGSMQGFVPASGSGASGVLVVAEAAGEHEAHEGMPLVGKAGFYLWQNLQRAGILREGFRVHNVLSCRPPENKLAGMWYEQDVISHCAPLLDATIAEMKSLCRQTGKTFTIVTLGRVAFKRVMGFTNQDPVMREDYLCYPFWSEKYQAWVVAADHPSYLMRGNNHLLPVLQFAFKRALEIAEKGFAYHKPTYMRDPGPETFEQWMRDYEEAWMDAPDSTFLSFDIETPMKQGQNEDELVKEDGDDYQILRCSFAYREGEAISVPWRAEYTPILEELFSHPGSKIGWNCSNYDIPRIQVQMPVRGDVHDAMLMWHVLNTALPKALGFVAPFYAQDTEIWKHQSSSDPAGYNAQDADIALRCFNGIRRDLIGNDLWKVYSHHVVELNRALAYMSGVGVKLDVEGREASEKKLQDLLDATEIKMEGSVPQGARKYKVFKKTPKDTTGLVQMPGERKSKKCPRCGAIDVKAAHFKSIGKKRLKAGEPENGCFGETASAVIVSTTLWAAPLAFKISKQSLTNYQKALKHQAIMNRKEKKVTFDESALMKLIKQHPNDPLYPLILEHREIQKLLSTYVGVTQYVELDVPDDYVLQPGEKWK